MSEQPRSPLRHAFHFGNSFFKHPRETAHLVNLGFHAPKSVLSAWGKVAAVGLIALGGAVFVEGAVLQDIEGLALGGVDMSYGGDILLEAGEKVARHLPPPSSAGPASGLS